MPTTDYWNGNGNWAGTPGDWSLGAAPTASEIAEIQSGGDTLNTSASVAGLTIDSATLYITRPGALSVSGGVSNSGSLDLASSGGDGGAALTVTGALTNGNTITIGNTSLSASTRLTTASLNNTGTININGETPVGTTHQGTLEITGPAPLLLTGTINLYGDALLQLDSGTIETIAGGAQLFLQGGSARVSAGAGTTNSGLANLSTNAGNLYLEGNLNGTHGGVDVSTNLGLANIATFHVDAGSAAGGSDIGFGGALYNIGTTYIGNAGLSLPTTVTADAFANIGTLTIQGNQTAYTNKGSTLGISAAAPTAITANLSLEGDAELAFNADSSLQMIGPGASLQMDGGGAQITATGDGANSALSNLSSNAGTFDVEGDSNVGPGGTSIYTDGAFTNTATGTFHVDAAAGAGDTAISFGGAFNNYGSTTIGNTGLSLPTTVDAEGYANSGSLTINGDQTDQAINQAALLIYASAPAVLTGSVSLYGDALLDFFTAEAGPNQPAEMKSDATSSGSSFTSIGYNASLLENGAQAWVGYNNAELSGLSLNDGKLSLQGDANGSSGGVTLSTDGAFANVGEFDVDDVGGYAGGSTIAIGGALTNAGLIHGQSALFSIGNGDLGAPTTVSASSLTSSGRLDIVGAEQLDATNQAALIIAGAAPTVITGAWNLNGDALLQFGSGSVTTVDNGSSLELDGAAQVSDSGGAVNSALGKLASNFGTVQIGSNDGNGAGDEAVSISTGLFNTGDFYVDQGGNSGGSTVSIAGKLTNANLIEIGATSLNNPTSVSVGSLTNTGSIYLAGSTSAPNQAVLHVAGAAGFGTAGVLTGYVQLNGDSLLEFDSGSIATIAANATLDIVTGQSPNGGFFADASDTTHNSALNGLSDNAGTLGLAFGAVIATTSGTAFRNTGTVNIDNFDGSDGGSALDIGGALTNAGTMAIGGGGESVATAASAASLANYGAISLQGSTNAPTTFTVGGIANNYGAVSIGSNTTLTTNGHPFNQMAGTAAIAGTVTASAINAQGGLVDFTTPATSTGALNIYGGGTMEFAAAASQTVNFKATTGVLQLGSPSTFSGTIAGFSGDDIIDLLNTAVTGLSYAGGVLTVSGSSGTVASLNFSGTYTNTSFASVSDGHGGTDILLTPISQWNGSNANWTAADWDVTPTSASTAVLGGGNGYTVTVNTNINVGSIITTDPNAGLYFGDEGGTGTVESNLVNGGGLYVDSSSNTGGDTLNIGGALVNINQFTLGDATLDANSMVTAASLDNSGTIDLWGNNSPAPSDQATLDITGAAPSTLTGQLLVHGDSLVEFGSGGITAIARNAELQLNGVNARLSIGAGTTNSALAELATNAGTFDMEGDWDAEPGGSSVTTKTALANSGTLSLDVSGGGGASSLSIGGSLNNTGTVNVGISNLSATTTLSAKSLVDNGTINVIGDNNASAGSNQAQLIVSGAAPTELDGRLVVWGDALVQFGSGSLTKIGAGGSLAMDGSRAQISDKGGTFNSALSKLTTNAGSISLNGNTGYGSGGESVTTSVALTNLGTLIVDSYGGYGGTTLTIGGALDNQGGTNNSQGQITIGNSTLSANTTVQASSLVNNGTIDLWGNDGLTPSYQATLDITGAAPTTLTGRLLIHGDSLVEFESGGVKAIAAGAELQLDGVNARMSLGAGVTNSALDTLASNAGLLDIEGNWDTGPGGSSVSTTAAFTNTGTFEMDVYGADGGSSFSTTQGFTNEGAVTLGNTTLSKDTTLTVKTLANRGSITLWGSNASSPTNQTLLDITGTGPASLTGDLSLYGDSMVEYASGGTGVTSIAAGATLQLAGSHALISIGTGTTNSALAKLASVAGVFDMEGNWNSGSGGVTVTTTTALSNTGKIDLDVDDGGGSTFTIGGALTNVGAFNIGSGGIGATTAASAKSLVNSGTISLTSSGSFSSTLTITGAAANDGVVVIGAGSLLDDSDHPYTQNAGTTTVAGTLKASSVEDYGGLINFTTALINGNGAGALNIHAGGIMEFGAAVGTGHTVTFEDSTGMLQLGAPSSFAGTIAGFSGNDVIDLLSTTVTSFSYSGQTLTLYDNGDAVAALNFSGSSYTDASFTTVSDGHGGTDIVDPPAAMKTNASWVVSADTLVQSIAAFDTGARGVSEGPGFVLGLTAQKTTVAANLHADTSGVNLSSR